MHGSAIGCFVFAELSNSYFYGTSKCRLYSFKLYRLTPTYNFIWSRKLIAYVGEKIRKTKTGETPSYITVTGCITKVVMWK